MIELKATNRIGTPNNARIRAFALERGDESGHTLNKREFMSALDKVTRKIDKTKSSPKQSKT